MSLVGNEQPAPPKPRKRRKNTEFWRACRFLYPYRRLVVISIISALFVGGLTTGGLAAMLPILRVLMNDDTVGGWVDRQIVAQQLGITLSDEKLPHVVSIPKPTPA